MKLWHCLWGMVVIIAFLYARETKACDCEGPGARFLQLGGVLPANSKGLVWFSPNSRIVDKDEKNIPPNYARFKVEIRGKNEYERIPFEIEHLSEGLWIVVPKQEMHVGERFRFSFQLRGQSALWESVVDITIGKDGLEKQKSPSRLKIGTLNRGEVTISSSPRCSITIEAGKRSIELVLPPAAVKYRQALLYSTFVDGKLWRPESFLCANIPYGRSWMDLGKDLLYSVCDKKLLFRGLSKGTHKVRMTATLPGVGVIADSGEVEVEIGCE